MTQDNARNRMDTLDEALCFSKGISFTDFRDYIWSHPDANFEECCEQTGLGSACTACIPNAQEYYTVCRREQPADFIPNTPLAKAGVKASSGLSKKSLYALIDRLSPKAPFLLKGVIPVFGGQPFKTTLSISNAIPPNLEAKSPPFELRLERLDHDGRALGSEDVVLPPGERLDRVVSEGLGGEGQGPRYGACWIYMKAQRIGHRGSIRPHFTVEGQTGATTLHSQGGGKRQAGPMMTVIGSSEEQFVSLLNCEDKPAEIDILIDSDGGRVDTHRQILPAYSSTMLSITNERTRKASRTAPIMVQMVSTAKVRPHLVVSDCRLGRLSLDHM